MFDNEWKKWKERWTQKDSSVENIVYYMSESPTNSHWARVVGYGPFSLWVIHKEGLCPSSGDINRLMMMSESAWFIVKSVCY
jgi:hypothetical protein